LGRYWIFGLTGESWRLAVCRLMQYKPPTADFQGKEIATFDTARAAIQRPG
jgi:hypothetical protein